MNPASSRDFDKDNPDQAWHKGFDQGYEKGRMSLIQEILAMIEMDKIKEMVDNETN